MKKSTKYLIQMSLALLFWQCISAGIVNAQTEMKIANIRARVTAIEKGAAKYTKTTKNVEGISLEGTEATSFHSGSDVKKITAKMYGETYNATGEFYYENGELIFAFVKHNQYDTQIVMNPPPKVTRSEEQRFYFAGGELIRLLVGKKELKSGDQRYAEMKDEIISVSSKLQE